MSLRHDDRHLSDERLQALLDGDLSDRESLAASAHVRECEACRVRADEWRSLFVGLGELPTLSPSPAFRERVLEAAVPRPVGAGARVRGWLGLEGDAANPAHVGSARLQEYMEGRLAARTTARVEAHLDGCAVCRRELSAYEEVGRAVSRLPAYAPSEGFAEAVMAGFRVEQLARAVLQPTTRSARVLGWLRNAVPSSRRGWAAALGVGVVPAVVASLAIYAVFSHPLVTVGSLASFAWFKVSTALTALVESVAAPFVANPLAARAWALLEPVLASSRLTALSATALSAFTLAALWILYRNVFSSDSEGQGYAQSTL